MFIGACIGVGCCLAAGLISLKEKNVYGIGGCLMACLYGAAFAVQVA